MTSYKYLYKNKVVDPSEKRFCAKFEPFVTNSFAKNGKKWFIAFLQFYVFGLFDLQNDLQIQIWPDPPNIVWGCSIFLFLWFFCQGAPYDSKFHFKYIFISFWAFDHLSLWFFIFSHIFHSFCIHIHAAGLRTNSLLLFHLCFICPSKKNLRAQLEREGKHYCICMSQRFSKQHCLCTLQYACTFPSGRYIRWT